MKLVRSGAVNGMWAFLAYGIAEAFFAELLPWAMGRIDDLEWESTAILVVVYAAMGLTLGAIGGAVVSALRLREPERAIRAAAIIGVALPYAVNASRVSPAIGTVLPLGSAFVVLCAALVSLQAGKLGDRVAASLSYWGAAFVLAGVPAISKDLMWYRPAAQRAAGSAAFLALLVGAAYITRRIRFRPVIVAASALAITPCFLLLAPKLELPGPEALGPSAASGKPNVVLVVLDTVRADHLSLYGYERRTTPELERFAAQSTVYTNAVSTSDMTLASHASLFTGLYPSWHAAHYTAQSPMGNTLAPAYSTLAEVLAEHGYLTLGVAANVAYLQRVYGLDQGFSFWSVRGGFFLERDAFWLRQGVRLALSPYISARKGMAYRRAGEINDEAFVLLNRVRGARRPFFLFINYMDAHWPYHPPKPFDALYPNHGPAFSDAGYYALAYKVITLKHKITAAERGRLVGRYDGAINYLDSEVGMLIARLKAQGLYDNTLLIVTADHGETFGERNFVNHSVSVYQDQVRVPLVVKYPHQARGAVVDRVVSGVDVMPTVLGAAGYAAPAGVQGEDLLRAGDSRDVLAESFPNVRYYSVHPRFQRVQRAIFRGSRKLVASSNGRTELFDTARDPDELRDLSAAEKDVTANLRAALERTLQGAGAEARKQGGDPELKKAEVERLKSLGYVQ